MKVSLIINTYNRMFSLPNTLRSLEYLRYPELEVIVVDGPSTDGTRQYLKENWDGKIKLCICDEANLSVSRNVGIQNASGEIICFTDDDGIPEPDWLDKLIPAFDDPKVGAAGGWTRDHTGVAFQTKCIKSCRNSTSDPRLNNVGELPDCRPFAREFPGLIGVNSCFRRSALLHVSGFDEEYAYFLDETDVLVRLIDAGHLVRTIPAAEVHHKVARSPTRSASGAALSWVNILRSRAYFVMRHALPESTIHERMADLEHLKDCYRASTETFVADGLIDAERRDKLMDDITAGANQGVTDVFASPCATLLRPFSITPWKPFLRRLPADQRLHIAFLTTLYPPRKCGGVAVLMNTLARRMAELGHEVTVITQAGEGDHTVEFEDGIWVHRLPYNDSLPMELPAGMPEMAGPNRKVAGNVLAELNRVNDRRRFDFVLGSLWDLDIAAVIASKKYPTGLYLVTAFKLMEDTKPEWKQNPEFWRNHVCKMIEAERWALENADHILASTHAIRRDVENAYGLSFDDGRVTHLPFGLALPACKTTRRTDDRLRLLYVGRFENRKGADVLLAALPALLAHNANLEVICAGEDTLPGPDGETYKQKFTREHSDAAWFNRIQFLGHISDEALEQAYADCDIFVAPSRYESFGLIYLEAMRYGKPCIGTTAGGIPEVILDNRTGLLAAPGDVPSLANAIQRLIDDSVLRRRMGQAGMERFHETFAVERFADNLADHIRKWIGAHQ